MSSVFFVIELRPAACSVEFLDKTVEVDGNVSCDACFHSQH